MEARSIIKALKTVRWRPGLDELLALIAQIAKTDRGLQEINRAKTQMSQPVEKTAEKHKSKSAVTNRARGGSLEKDCKKNGRQSDTNCYYRNSPGWGCLRDLACARQSDAH